MTDLATKISKNIFCYHLIGFDMNILYDVTNRNLVLADSKTGAPIRIVEKDEDLDFETFVLIAQNMFMDLLDSLN